jgi:DNA modification methylase
MWSNAGETVLTPCMGVGSEVYGSVLHGRSAIGIELKPSYYAQAVLNVKDALEKEALEQSPLFAESILS